MKCVHDKAPVAAFDLRFPSAADPEVPLRKRPDSQVASKAFPVAPRSFVWIELGTSLRLLAEQTVFCL